MRQRGAVSARPCPETRIGILRFGDRFGTLPTFPPRAKKQEGPEQEGQLAFAGVCIHLCRDNTSDRGGSNLKKEGLATVASPFPGTHCEEGGYPHSFIEAIAFLASSMLPYLPMDFMPSGILCMASHLWLAGSNTT